MLCTKQTHGFFVVDGAEADKKWYCQMSCLNECGTYRAGRKLRLL